VASRSNLKGRRGRQSGFTLLEALVSLALVLAFAEALGPHLLQARRIVDHAEGRVAAQVLLRSLLDAPFDRSNLARTSREGETNGLRWRIVAEPVAAAMPGASGPASWSSFKVIASVAWAPNQVIMAETIRLGKPEQ
jgi:type II secretory pathway component PulJ